MWFNKVFGALLAVALIILGLPTLTDIVFGKGGHHGGGHEAEEKTLNERVAEEFAYYLPLSEGGGAAAEEEVFDLGAVLAAADVEKGASSFKSKCSPCHTIEAGGDNKQGPNLHDIVGRSKASLASFGGYSSALQGMDGAWTYENLNGFLENPKGYVSGTAMSFAGLRRDDERANVMAYLASETVNPPAFPEPLPEEPEMAEGEEGEEGAVVVEGDEAGVDGAIVEAGEGSAGAVDLEGAVEEAAETTGNAAQDLMEQGQAAVEGAMEDAGEAADEAGEAAEDMMDDAEEAVEDATDSEE